MFRILVGTAALLMVTAAGSTASAEHARGYPGYRGGVSVHRSYHLPSYGCRSPSFYSPHAVHHYGYGRSLPYSYSRSSYYRSPYGVPRYSPYSQGGVSVYGRNFGFSFRY